MLILVLHIRKLRDGTRKQLVQESEPSQDSNHAGQLQSPHSASVLYVYLGMVEGGGKAGREEGNRTKQYITHLPLQHLEAMMGQRVRGGL